MIVLYSKHFPPKGYKAITLGPIIIVRKPFKLDSHDLLHETIHWQQYKEMLIIFFLLWYAIEFLIRLLALQNWHRAYRMISLEQEAYNNEYDDDYLSKRKHFSWLKYL